MFLSVRWPCVIVGESQHQVNNNNSLLVHVFFISFSSQLCFASSSLDTWKWFIWLGGRFWEVTPTVKNAYFLVSDSHFKLVCVQQVILTLVNFLRRLTGQAVSKWVWRPQHALIDMTFNCSFRAEEGRGRHQVSPLWLKRRCVDWPTLPGPVDIIKPA